jgi:fatty-acyl-CoA synthase
MIIPEIMTKASRLYGAQEAVVCGDRRFTYREFDRRINALCRLLCDCGVKRGDRIAILHPNCHYVLEGYFAVAHVGAILVPINYRLSPRELAYILSDSESTVLIAEREFAPLVAAVLNERGHTIKLVLWTGTGNHGSLGIETMDYEEGIAKSSASMVAAENITETAIAQLYYTSGTTGRPKGVMLTHKNVCTHAVGAIAELHLTDSDRWIHAAPMFHLADAWAVWAITLIGGVHVCVRNFDPPMVLTIMEQERITITNMIPTMLNLLVNDPTVQSRDYSSLRVLLSGGAPIAPEIVKKIMSIFHCDYIQTYGMTETSPYLTLSIPKGHLAGLPPDNQLQIRAKTGREFIAVQLRVVREDGTEVAKDEHEVGEIIVKGDTVTPGYWKLPEETAGTIKDGWLSTGDLAVMDPEGYVTIVGRKKDIIITGGENVYSTEVEHVLYEHPAILEAAVIGVPDAQWGEMVTAIVVLRQESVATAEEIINFCKQRLARFKAPKAVEFVSTLPRTGSGKISKRELRKHHGKNIM